MIKRAFTLFEIALCVCLLGLIATAIGWQIKGVVTRAHFHKNLDMLVTDLRKMQIVALSNRCDLEMQITKKKGHYAYLITLDEPSKIIGSSEVKLMGVKKIKGTKDPITLIVYSSGRIAGEESITLYQDDENKVALNFENLYP